MNAPSSETRSLLLMLGSVGCFAGNVLIIRALSLRVPAVDGWVALVFRGLVGLILVMALFGRRGLRLDRLVTRPMLILRGLLGGTAILCLYLAIVHIGAARSVLINLSYPVFGSLFAAMWLGERLAARAWGWMLASFGGLVIFLAPGFLFSADRFSPYDLLALASAVAAGGVVVLIRRLHASEHSATIYAAQCGACLLISAVPGASRLPRLPAEAILLLALAAGLVAVGQLALTHAFRALSVSRGSSIQMLLPLVIACGSWLWFDERFTPLEMAAGALTLLATWQVVRTRSALG